VKRTILFLMVLLASVPAAANSFSGRVIGVMDGDTILVLTSGYEQMKVRLAEIDAPEKAQPFGERSKQALSALCFKKLAYVEVVDIDRYKRAVGKVSCEGIDVNRSQVESGMAWVYRRYAKDSSLLAVEGMAKAGRRGLWADANPTPPWEWRKSKQGPK
jgi:endonuclease YncB( thermonuclease family)